MNIRSILFVFALLVVSLNAHAATLYWNGPLEGTVDIEKKDANGTFTFVERVNANPPKYTVPTGAWGEYRLSFPGGVSNSVVYSADLDTGTVARVDALETRVSALENPPTSNFTVTQIDADHLEIIGTGCIGLSTSGTGTKRIITCKH